MIAKLVVWDNRAQWLPVLLLSSVGAVLGGRIADLVSPHSDIPGFHPTSILLALVGAAILLVPYGKFMLRRHAAATTPLAGSDRRAA